MVGGGRVSKADLRMAASGDVDELNCVLGLVVAELDERTSCLRPVLEELQRELFSFGFLLASPRDFPNRPDYCLGPEAVLQLESWCDEFSEKLPELRAFVLPGGGKVAALLHVARATARRAERSVVRLLDEAEAVEEELLVFINRLSDLLFVLARWARVQNGGRELVWEKKR